MNKIIFIFFLAFSGLFAQKKPLNVLVLYSDDHRFNTIRALGNDQIFTPNLDKLVKNGIAFTRYHTMGGLHGALCVPSRAMLHTGRYLHGLQKAGDVIPPEHITMPEYLKTKNYQTFAVGKWHNDKASFMRSYSEGAKLFFGGMHFPEKGGQENPQYVDYDPTGIYKTPNQKANKYSSELYADEAIAFLNRQNFSEKPFYCYVAFTSPHDPRTPPESFKKLYPANKIKLLPNFMPQHPFDNGELTVRDEVLLPRPLSEQNAKEELALYYAMISELDAQIGRILDALEKNGQKENTLVIFAGDNGLAVGSHGLLGKQNLYDQSMRMPLIISAPPLPKNIKNDALSYISDVFPTVLDILDLPKPTTIEGESLLPFIKNPTQKGRASVYFAYRDLQRGVRTDDNWKMIKYLVKNEEITQLFDLNKDPFEINNLAKNKDFQAKNNEMTQLLANEMKRFHDFLDIQKPNWGKL